MPRCLPLSQMPRSPEPDKMEILRYRSFKRWNLFLKNLVACERRDDILFLLLSGVFFTLNCICMLQNKIRFMLEKFWYHLLCWNISKVESYVPELDIQNIFYILYIYIYVYIIQLYVCNAYDAYAYSSQI